MSAKSHKVIKRVQVTPVILTGGFTLGDAMHTGAVKLENALQSKGSGKLVGIGMSDLQASGEPITVAIFDRDPSNTTITAGVALNINDSDLPNMLCTVSIATAEYRGFASNGFVTKSLSLPVVSLSGSKDLYMALRTEGTTNFTAANSLTFNLFFEQD